MECCKKDKEKEKEKCVSSFDDVMRDLSCGVRKELIENHHCILGALTRSTLNTATSFISCKLIELLERVAPKFVME